jgi:hypothetical protein
VERQLCLQFQHSTPLTKLKSRPLIGFTTTIVCARQVATFRRKSGGKELETIGCVTAARNITIPVNSHSALSYADCD